MIYLKQSTAKTLRFGPFLDETDGKTAETGLTISQADIRLSKSGGDFAQSNDSSGATHDEAGWYYLQLDATDTNTLGPLVVAIHESGALPVWREFCVVKANWFDTMFSTDYLQTDTIQIEGSDATDQINAACDTAIETYGLDHLVSASVTGTDITDNSIIAKMTSKNATADWDSFNNITDSLEAISDTSSPSAATIADAVWDENKSGHTSANTYGKLVADVEVDTADMQPKFGTFVDLGDGTTVADNFTSLAGKTANAGSFNRATDSTEAIRDRGDADWSGYAGGGSVDIYVS